MLAFLWFLGATLRRGVRCSRSRDPALGLLALGITRGFRRSYGAHDVRHVQGRSISQLLCSIAGLLVAIGTVDEEKRRGASGEELSVILITRNQAWNVDRLVGWVLREAPDAEVVLVDSLSDDDTVAPRAASHPIRVLRFREGWTLAPPAGRYVGTHHVSGDAILFLDGDMDLCPGWLAEALDTLHRFPDVAAVTGEIIDVVPGDEPPDLLPTDPPRHVGGGAYGRLRPLPPERPDEVGHSTPIFAPRTSPSCACGSEQPATASSRSIVRSSSTLPPPSRRSLGDREAESQSLHRARAGRQISPRQPVARDVLPGADATRSSLPLRCSSAWLA